MNAPHTQPGFTLVEIMIVIALMSILVTLLIPQFQPNAAAQLQSAAEVVASDIAFARSLSVSRASRHTITFDIAGNEYALAHSGVIAAFDDLPATPFHYDDAATERTTRLDDLPTLGTAAQLAAVHAQPASGSPTAVTTVEFQPLGQTTRSETTVVWLKIGRGASRRYIPIEIDPVTGLETVGDLTDTLPVAAAAVE